MLCCIYIDQFVPGLTWMINTNGLSSYQRTTDGRNVQQKSKTHTVYGTIEIIHICAIP